MHRNAPLTPEGRLRLCNLIEDGWTGGLGPESMRISRQTAHKWWRRYQERGDRWFGGSLRAGPEGARPRPRTAGSAALSSADDATSSDRRDCPRVGMPA